MWHRSGAWQRRGFGEAHPELHLHLHCHMRRSSGKVGLCVEWVGEEGEYTAEHWEQH